MRLRRLLEALAPDRFLDDAAVEAKVAHQIVDGVAGQEAVRVGERYEPTFFADGSDHGTPEAAFDIGAVYLEDG